MREMRAMQFTHLLGARVWLFLAAPLAGCASGSGNWAEYDEALRGPPPRNPAYPLLGAWEGNSVTPSGRPDLPARALFSLRPRPCLFGDKPLLPDAYLVEYRLGDGGGPGWWTALLHVIAPKPTFML